MRNYDTTVFEQGLEKLGISLDQKQIEQFLQYYEILVEWNKVMNLTGITEFEEVIVKHFLDSLAIVKVCDMNKVNTVIDIGTGAGFPGIPLKIAFPHLEVVLLDSLRKRITFLEEIVQQLGLVDITMIHGRAEEFARKSECREQFDLSVSRAVANLSTLGEYCLPFVKIGGEFISYKSGKIAEEVEQAQKAIEVLGGENISSEVFNLLDTDMERSFVRIKKKNKTPNRYPRKAGQPSKEPIN
jgi:16S rRNA (guanine(527)-N(7))-methyltransferase GidB